MLYLLDFTLLLFISADAGASAEGFNWEWVDDYSYKSMTLI